MKKTFKKIFGVIVCLSLMLPIGLSLTGCSHNHVWEENYHHNATHHWKVCVAEEDCDKTSNFAEHIFGQWQTRTAATCLAAGEEYRACECGYEETRAVNGLGHDIVDGICSACHYGAVASIGETYFTSFADAIASIEDKSILTTIVLFDDVMAPAVKVTSGYNIIFDLNGHTYVITQPAVGSTGTTTSGFQLLKDSNITFKNGTITHATSYTQTADTCDVQILIQNYCNLTLENVTLDAKSKLDGAVVGTCLYALSNNNGLVTLKGNTNIVSDEERSAGNGGVAFDLWYSNSYSNGVTVKFDSTFTGVVAGKIEYGAHSKTTDENWENKTALVIESGIFSADQFVFTNNVDAANIVITGGTFKCDVSAYVAPGYKCISDSLGNWKVEQE